jgi:hypothetical protein
MNQEPLSAQELQALLEAIGESPPSDGDDQLKRELREDFALLNAAFQPVSPMPAEILSRLQSNADELWDKRYGQRQANLAGGEKARRFVPSQRLAIAAMVLVLGLVVGLFFRDSDSTQPTFAWTNASDPQQKYDVWVLPAEGDVETIPALFVTKEVRSPVNLADMKPSAPGTPLKLEKDKPHRLLVCLASVGRFGGDAVSFKSQPSIQAATPTAPAVLKRLIDKGRIADAKKVLSALPASVLADPEVQALTKQL